jgi:hypothetical protein
MGVNDFDSMAQEKAGVAGASVSTPEEPEVVLANGVLESIVVFIFPDVRCVEHVPLSLLLSCGP